MCKCDRCHELHGELWCDVTAYEDCPYYMKNEENEEEE